jgi:hypothetical protein
MAGLMTRNRDIYPVSEGYITSFASFGEAAPVSVQLTDAVLPIITYSNNTKDGCEYNGGLATASLGIMGIDDK